ncbi:MAG: fructosamine kinase family protein [Paucimonas sp.]|jgi:hypothetical protein|nr:fructosamine kinase family protein [Paucimonas sp.]
MSNQQVEYRGFSIVPDVASQDEAMYYGGYEISKNGRTIRVRRRIFPGFFYFSAAVTSSIEHAKLEIDNLEAMGGDEGRDQGWGQGQDPGPDKGRNQGGK